MRRASIPSRNNRIKSMCPIRSRITHERLTRIVICRMSETEKRWPVTFVNLGMVPITKQLQDVDGHELFMEDGRKLTLCTKGVRELFETGRLRCVYNLRKGYRYFVTSRIQQELFQDERVRGSPYFATRFYIYRDNA